MLQVFAPKLPRGYSWVILVLVGLSVARVASGQTPAEKGAAKPPAANPVEPPAKPDANDNDDAPKEERFTDPNAKATIAIIKPLNYTSTGRQIKILGAGNDLTRVQNMASRVENEDPVLIKAYIEYFAVELSKRDNINAIIAPPQGQRPDAPAARGLERAVDALTRPIIDSRANDNPAFLTSYTRALFESSLPKLMDNNYFSRINAMIVLGMAGGTSNTALDFYATQLKDSDQIIWVKMWAARGYTNATQSGHVNIDALKAISAADALVTFLNSDPKLPYFAQFRALEALGSIRVATATRPNFKLDAASVVARFLVDDSARPETRAWAAWALGMFRVAPQVAPYNFALAGSEIGNLAVSLGTMVVAEYDQHVDNFDRDKDQATTLTSLLMFQVVPSFSGEEGVSDSGLLRSGHPGLAAARPVLTKIDEKIKAVSREAYELLRAGGNDKKGRRDALEAKVGDLKAYLDQNKPRDRRLVPDGLIFPVPAPAKVASGHSGMPNGR